MNKLKFIPIIGIPEIKSGDNIPKIINKGLFSNKINLKNNDILVLTQKIISKSENRIIDLDSVKPKSKAIKLGKELNKNAKLVQLILDESKSIIKIDKNRGIIITETKLGHICANSGIDSSNIYGSNNVSLLPKNPDRSAKLIFNNLIQDHEIENLGAKFFDFLKNNLIEDVTIFGPSLNSKNYKLEEFIHGMQLKSYTFNIYKFNHI